MSILKIKFMKQFINKHLLKIIGSTVGAIAGFAYFYYIGCPSGSCPITSNPYISVGYGAILGYLFFDMFKTKKRENESN
jgi:hypothetical protein